MRDYLACLCALLPITLAAQSPPTFVPKADALFTAQLHDLPAITAALPKTSLGRLLAQPDVAAAWATGADRHRARNAHVAALLQKAIDLKIPATPWRIAEHADRLFAAAWEALEWQDVRDLALVAAKGQGDDQWPGPRNAMVVRLLPRVEGKATQRFDAAARDVERSEWMTPTADAKFGGVPARVFAAKPPAEGAEQFPFQLLGAWMVHLPGTFAYGTGTPAECGDVGERPDAGAGASIRMDLQAWFSLLSGGGATVPPPVIALGLDRLHSVRWQIAFDGEALRDDIAFSFAPQPGGLIAGLLTGTAPLVRQALPKGAIAQLRTAADVPMLLDALQGLTGGGLLLPREDAEAIARTLTGGIALGVAAPASGGLVPRLFATLGVTDEAATRAWLGKLLGGGRSREVTHDGIAMSTLTVAGMPAVLQPTFCVHDGALHIAESLASMRALLAAQRDGADAMAIGDVPPLAAGPTVVPGFDLRWDAAALYRAFHATWLPLFELTVGQDREWSAQVVQRDDLPDPDVVAEHLGQGRGVLLRDGASLTLRQQGGLGGIELAAFALAFGPIVMRLPGRANADNELELAVGRRQLDAVWPALQTFHDKNGRWPQDLAELFTAGKLAPDALLLPGDDGAEPIAAGNAAAPRSSFRYFPAGAAFVATEGSVRALLVEIRPRPQNRLTLTEGGTTPEVYGSESTKPIGQFGK